MKITQPVQMDVQIGEVRQNLAAVRDSSAKPSQQGSTISLPRMRVTEFLLESLDELASLLRACWE